MGAQKLAEAYKIDVDLIDVDTVKADVELDQGYQSYGSFDESASAYVLITGRLVKASEVTVCSRDYFDFGKESKIRYTNKSSLRTVALESMDCMSLSYVIKEVLESGESE